MEEFLESVKSETKDLFRSKKNLINLLILVVLILALPLSVNLVRQQQIIKSRAAAKSKLSIQTSWQKPGAMEFIETAKPVVVKLLGGYDRAGEIKQKSPNTFIVGRIWEPDQPMDGDPGARAQQWFDRNRGTLEGFGIDCWEGYNEPDTNLMSWHAQFEIVRMQLLESIGKKACIASFSTGNPPLERWPEFMAAIDYATPRGHFLALHEYGPNRMDTDFIWHAGRHKQIYAQYGLSLPLIITETGIDSNGDPETGGWRAHTNDDDYLEQLKWYDSELQQDGYVVGATIFSYGLYDWDSFELYPELVGSDGRSGPLTQYIASGEGGGGGGAPACDQNQVNMSVFPSDGTVRQNMTFNVSGNQGSTYIGDNWSGGVNCAGDFWGSKTCSATTNGSFTWTHFWKNCAPNNCSITSSQCSKLLNFTVGGAGGSPSPSNTRLYIDPNPVNLRGSVTAIATGTTSCSTYISTSFGAGLSCDDPNVLTCSQPNPKNDGNPCWWRWVCTAGNTAGNYTATFNAAGTNCASSKNYTIVSPTPTPTPTPTKSPSPTKTPTPTPKSTPVSTPTPIPTLTPTPTPRPPLSTVFPALPPAQAIYDLNNDLKINAIDVGIFLEDWRNIPSSSNYDFNDDRVRNSIDYAMLAVNLRQ